MLKYSSFFCIYEMVLCQIGYICVNTVNETVYDTDTVYSVSNGFKTLF